MLERTIRESWTSSDVKELRIRLKALSKSKVPFYEQCQVWASKIDEDKQAARERGEEVPDGEDLEAMPFGISNYGHSFDMIQALKTLSERSFTVVSLVVFALMSQTEPWKLR
jgi:hypothetical protein